MTRRKQPAHRHAYLNCPPSMTFDGMAEAVASQETAAAAYQGEELTAEMRKPLGDISHRAGEMERRSPLFFGTGDNPSLF